MDFVIPGLLGLFSLFLELRDLFIELGDHLWGDVLLGWLDFGV
jgi:hypothetical protein